MNGVFVLTMTSVLSAVAPFGTGLVKFRRLSAEMKILVLLFLFAAMVEGITFYQAVNGRSVRWLQHLYTPISYGFLIYVFSCWLPGKNVKRTLVASIPVFALVCAGNMLIPGNLNAMNILTQSVANIVLALVSLYTILSLLRKDTGTIHRDYRFWICAGVLLYSAGSLGYFTLHNVISDQRLVVAWYFHVGVNILANLFYSAGFLCRYGQA